MHAHKHRVHVARARARQVRELQDHVTALQGQKTGAEQKAESLAEKVGDLTRKSHTATLELTARQQQIRGLSVSGVEWNGVE
jgi:hypothetical protein